MVDDPPGSLTTFRIPPDPEAWIEEDRFDPLLTIVSYPPCVADLQNRQRFGASWSSAADRQLANAHSSRLDYDDSAFGEVLLEGGKVGE